jgi:D-alanine-D-alanine ligase
MDGSGELFVLEINPNCGVFYEPHTWGGADRMIARGPLGHRGFLEHLMRCAARRAKAARRNGEG